MSEHELVITDVISRAVNAPLAQPITTASGAIPTAPLILIDLQTSEGIVGRAYVFGYSKISLRPIVELVSQLKEMIVGKPVAPVERMREFDNGFRLLGHQGLLGMAISGLDMAMWDALARAHGLSVARFLGGQDTPIPAYASHGVIDLKRDAGLLQGSVEQGFSAIKIKIGAGDLSDDLRVVSGVRKIIGNNVGLMVDYNQSLSVPEATRRISRLAEFDLLWVEEPVRAEDLAGHAAVRASSPIGIQTGENWWFPEDAARAIAARASDFAMFDLMKIGGVSGWLRAAGQAEGACLPVSSHIFVEASAHVLAVTPTMHFLEHLDLASALLAEPVVVEAGAVRPRGPGFGIDWNEAAVSKYQL